MLIRYWLDGDIDDHDVMISKNLCEGGEERLKAGKMSNQLKSWVENSFLFQKMDKILQIPILSP